MKKLSKLIDAVGMVVFLMVLLIAASNGMSAVFLAGALFAFLGFGSSFVITSGRAASAHAYSLAYSFIVMFSAMSVLCLIVWWVFL